MPYVVGQTTTVIHTAQITPAQCQWRELMNPARIQPWPATKQNTINNSALVTWLCLALLRSFDTNTHLKRETVCLVNLVAHPVAAAGNLPSRACLVLVHVKHSVTQATSVAHHWHRAIAHGNHLQEGVKEEEHRQRMEVRERCGRADAFLASLRSMIGLGIVRTAADALPLRPRSLSVSVSHTHTHLCEAARLKHARHQEDVCCCVDDVAERLIIGKHKASIL